MHNSRYRPRYLLVTPIGSVSSAPHEPSDEASFAFSIACSAAMGSGGTSVTNLAACSRVSSTVVAAKSAFSSRKANGLRRNRSASYPRYLALRLSDSLEIVLLVQVGEGVVDYPVLTFI
jgi:hypothetical protein